MKPLKIEGKQDIPFVELDDQKGKFEISGRSFPEDAVEFYKPVMDWISLYSEGVEGRTVFDFKMDYISTASSKAILDVMFLLESLSKKGKEVVIRWFYFADDEDMEESGLEYEEIVNVKFEHIKMSVLKK